MGRRSWRRLVIAALSALAAGCGSGSTDNGPSDGSPGPTDGGLPGESGVPADGGRVDGTAPADAPAPPPGDALPADGNAPVDAPPVDAGNTAIVNSAFSPWGIAVDSANVYYADGHGSVWSCAVGGCAGSPTKLATGGPPAGPLVLTTTPLLVWTSVGATGDLLASAPGGQPTPTTLSPAPNATHAGVAGTLALFSSVDSVFYCDGSGCGGQAQALYTSPTGTSITTGIAADGTDVYFGEAPQGAVRRCPLPQPGDAAVPACDLFYADSAGRGVIEVAVDASSVFFALDDGSIVSCPKAAVPCTAPKLIINETNVTGLALSGSYVYYSGRIPGVVARCSKPGATIDGGPQPVTCNDYARGQSGPRAIAVDGSRVYWTNDLAGTVNAVAQ
jgi:hypothetical protein